MPRLTFDDGYLDHFTTVFPLLHERGWQGSFFPPVRPCRDYVLLDVNKVHFTLAACNDHGLLVDAIRDFVSQRQGVDTVRSFAAYWDELAVGNRLDPPQIVFIKRMLQHALPEALRTELADALFARFVSVDQDAFAAELYMSSDQLRMMIREGMYVGSHGAGHYWLDRLDEQAQARDIDESLAFLADLGAPVHDWVMCYPYGAHDDTVRALLRQRHCVIGLTTEVGTAEPGRDDPLAFARLDTNDLPA